MKKKYLYLVCIFVICGSVLLPGGKQTVEAQVPQPAQNNLPDQVLCLPGQPCQDEDGNWYIQQDARLPLDALADPKSTGGPDDYGYTWDDSVVYSWIDATDGTDTGISDTYGQAGPIDLPFTFPFYENAYSQIYITATGYVTFHDQQVGSQNEIPNSAEPNDIIAPFWSMNFFNTSSGWIHYKSGGTAPNRYFLVEWHQIEDNWGNIYTFEVLLYEDGNIKFQYKTIDLLGISAWATSAGIEDSVGEDGLAYFNWADSLPSANTAVLFTRPGLIARLRLSSIYLGEFTSPEGINDFTLTVTNTGELGDDTYDLTYTSTWPLVLLNASNQIALTDTDADGLIDTGPLAQGSSFDVLVRVTAPGGSTTGNANTAFVTVTSSLDSTKTKTVRLDSTIPAPFAQIYAGVNPGKTNLDLISSNQQTTIDLNLSDISYEPVVTETPDSNFVTVWSELVLQDDSFVGYILQYTQVDHLGQILRPVSDLTTILGGAGYFSYDISPVITAASNGNIGISWVHESYDTNAALYNYNVWFTLLDPEGNIIYGPTNLTNNTSWGTYQDGNYLYYSNISIAATDDNHFMISWDRSEQNGSDEIYYTLRQSNGDVIVAPTRIAEGSPGTLEYYDSSITALSSNRFFITYYVLQITETHFESLYNRYRVYDSNGNILKTETDTGLGGNSMNAIQLSGGNILIAGAIRYWNALPAIRYVLLNGSTYAPINISSDLVHPSTTDFFRNLSITKDNFNRAILTWSDENNKFLYYALINGSGSILSDPAIFHSSQEGNRIRLSYSGYSNTTKTWDPLANVDGTSSFDTSLYSASPGGSVSIGVNYANDGLNTATHSVLSLILDSGLTYTGDSSGITPSVIGDTVTWNLADLEEGESGHFTVYVTIPTAAPIGTLYSLDLNLTSDGVDSDPTNNADSAQVMSIEKVYLPALMK